METLNQINYCECCNHLLNNQRIVELELNSRTNLYCVPGSVPENESQGRFTFGATCAKKVLKNGGKKAA